MEDFLRQERKASFIKILISMLVVDVGGKVLTRTGLNVYFLLARDKDFEKSDDELTAVVHAVHQLV